MTRTGEKKSNGPLAAAILEMGAQGTFVVGVVGVGLALDLGSEGRLIDRLH